MDNKSHSVTTEEMWGRLFSAPSIDRYLAANDELIPKFSDYISGLCKARGERPEKVIRRGNIESSYGHRIFSGARKPSRDTVLQIAFGFEMDSEEAQQLLKIAREAALHPKVKRDAVIAYCLHNKISFMETQQYLFDNGMPLIGGGRRA